MVISASKYLLATAIALNKPRKWNNSQNWVSYALLGASDLSKILTVTQHSSLSTLPVLSNKSLREQPEGAVGGRIKLVKIHQDVHGASYCRFPIHHLTPPRGDRWPLKLTSHFLTDFCLQNIILSLLTLVINWIVLEGKERVLLEGPWSKNTAPIIMINMKWAKKEKF